MTRQIEVVYQNGAFHPLEHENLTFEEGQHIKILVEEDAAPVDILKLAQQVYDGLSEEDIDAIEEIALDRRHFFGRDKH